VIFHVPAHIEQLNVRSAPNKGASILRKLSAYDEVEASDIGGASAWAEIAPGEWACISLGNDTYLRPGPGPKRPTHPIGFDAPVGTEAERAAGCIWPGEWQDGNPFLALYGLGFHTGADLNLNRPTWDLDAHAPVYAISRGYVRFVSENAGGSWGGLIVIEHDVLSDGTPVWSRYGHIETPMVIAGQIVEKGQQIACIGEYKGPGRNYHLHFDISKTRILSDNPRHWPGNDRGAVVANYVDPAKFLRAYREGAPDECPGGGA
jgi:murein DD-endopeptidase MepM/ murein hydrolase activator NlpD